MTQPGGGSSSVHTFIFKTVGSAAVSGAVQSAQKHITSLYGSIQRASHSTKASAMSSQMYAAVTAKMAANIGNAEARLDAFREKVDRNTSALGRARQEYRDNEKELNRLYQSYRMAEFQLDAESKTVGENAHVKAHLRGTVSDLRKEMARLARAQADLAATVTTATQKEKLYLASLKAREARLKLLQVKQAEADKPLSKWEQWLATAIKVNKQITEITRTVNRVSRTFRDVSETIQRFMNIWDRLRGKRGAASGGDGMVADLGRGMEGTTTKVNILTRTLGFLGHTASFVLGQVIYGSLVRATQAFIGLIQQAFTAVSSFETLSISLRAMIGVQKMNENSSLALADALAASGKESIQLVKWLEKIAIISPFSSEDVKQAFQNAVAMGFNVEQAKRLTVATLDWAAANGKSGAQAEHVVFVLGQMRNASKLTYQDLMQLAQLGIGMDTINRALAKSLGKTVQEIARMREAGQITASQAIPALIQYMEQFSGAAKDQANTIQGLLSSLGDIGPIFMRALLGPMNETTSKVEGIVGALQTRLQGFVQFLQSNYLQNLAVTIGRGLGRIADNALVWGENVTIQFANGLINGLWAVLNSLTSIGTMVAHWLMPGSPPRILPDIDKWGAETLNEYFRGFSMANFGLFEAAISQVSSTIQAAFGDDRLGAVSTLLGIRTRLGAAIAGQGSIDNIFDGVAVPPELRQYVETLFRISEQTKVVDAAQKSLNDTIKKYDALLKPVDEALQAISNEQQDLTDDARIAQLRLIANDPNATATEKRLALLEIERLENEKVRRKIAADAKKEIDEKQGIVDAETEKLKVLEEQAALQKAFLDNQAESNRLLQDYINALEALEKKAGGGGGAGRPNLAAATPWGAGFGEGMKPGTDKMSELDRQLQAFVDTLTQKLSELRIVWGVVWTFIEEKLKPVKEAWAGLQIAWGALMTVFRATFPEVEQWVAQVFGKFVDFLVKAIPAAIALVTQIITGFATFWAAHHDTILQVVEFVWNTVVKIIAGLIFLIFITILGFLRLVNTNWSEKWEEFKTILATKWNDMSLRLAAKLLAIKATIFMRFLEIKADMAEIWNDIKEKARTTWVVMSDRIRTKLDEIKGDIKDRIEAALTYLTGVKERFVQVGKDFVQGIIDGIKAMTGLLAGAIASMVSGMFNTASNEAQAESPSKRAMNEIGKPIGQGTALGILATMPAVSNATASMVNSAITPPATGRQQWGQHVSNVTNSPQFVLNANMARDADSVVHEFEVMRALYGGVG